MTDDTPTEAPRADAHPFVFKILRLSEWSTLKITGEFLGSVDDKRDGYIHLSTGETVQATMDKYYTSAVTGGESVILAKVATADLLDDLRYELARGDDYFPHYYAPLPFVSVVDHAWIKPDDSGLYDASDFIKDAG